jgi:ADP-heptose:LPS heptosyltransferase
MRWDDLDLKNDFESTLALISRLDYVITAATAVHTMAAGVGVKTILMSSYGWTNVGTNYYPWFPNVEFVSSSDDLQPKPVSNCLHKVAELLKNSLTY